MAAGDTRGEMGRGAVAGGLWVEVAHFSSTAELYTLKTVLDGIEGTFKGSTITTEIR